MFDVRMNDLLYMKGRAMVLSGRVESGKVCIGARVMLRTPVTSVPAVLSGIERDGQIVSCVSASEDAALMIRGVDPEQLTGGVERVASESSPVPSWKVLSLRVVEAPARWWEFWR